MGEQRPFLSHIFVQLCLWGNLIPFKGGPGSWGKPPRLADLPGLLPGPDPQGWPPPAARAWVLPTGREARGPLGALERDWALISSTDASLRSRSVPPVGDEASRRQILGLCKEGPLHGPHSC